MLMKCRICNYKFVVVQEWKESLEKVGMKGTARCPKCKEIYKVQIVCTEKEA